jgi:O-antigen/teichoic acid export membrane protein
MSTTDRREGADAPEPSVEQPVERRRRDELVSNTGALLSGRVLIAAMGWAGTLLITNKALTTAQFGQFTFVFSLLGMMSIVTEMGVGRVAINGMMSDDTDRGRFAGSYVLMRCVMGMLGYLLAVAFVVARGYPPVIVRTTLVAGLVVLISTPNHAFHLVFQTSMRMPRVAAAEVIGQIAQLSLTVALVVRGGTVTWFALPAVLCEVVILMILWPLARRLATYHFVVDVRLWWSLLREAVPISLGAAMAIIYYRIDTLMIQAIKGYEAVAVYGVAYKFVDLAHFMVIALSVPILTVLVRAWPDDHARFRSTIVKGVTLLSVSALIVLTETMLFVGRVIPFLYRRPQYAAAAPAARILIVAECIGWFGSLAFSVLVATGRHRRYPLVTGGGLLLNVGLNLVVIPRHSFNGAAVDTLITEILVTSILWFLVLRIPAVRGLALGRFWRLVPAGVVGAAAGFGLRQIAPWPLAAALTALLVGGLVHVSRATGPGGLRNLVMGDTT